MQSIRPSVRPNLSSELTGRVRRLVVRGEIGESRHVNEVRLARDLGVSRTPLREALSALAAEGLVEIRPRRGFFVAPLDRRELEDLYGMRALLDPHALALGGVPPGTRLGELARLNRRLSRAASPGRAVELDNRWHRLLLAHCPSRILLRTIDQFIALTERYEHVYFRDTDHVEAAAREHEEIAAALGRGDLEGAGRALRRNLQSAVGPLAAWIEERRRR